MTDDQRLDRLAKHIVRIAALPERSFLGLLDSRDSWLIREADRDLNILAYVYAARLRLGLLRKPRRKRSFGRMAMAAIDLIAQPEPEPEECPL